MKITRTINGQEITIELTEEEMLRARSELDEEYIRETCEENIDLWLEESGRAISPELKTQMVDVLADDFDENMTIDDIEIAMNDCIENNKNQ